MESASIYYTRRARQERTKAADAGSAEARSAHLKLALLLVRAATEPALWSGWSDSVCAERNVGTLSTEESIDDLASALVDALPLPTWGSFEDLLDAIDKAERSQLSRSERFSSARN